MRQTALSPSRVFVLTGAGLSLIAVCYGLAPNAVILAAGVVLAGSSTGVASPPLAHAIARTVTAARQDRVQTTVNAGTGLGVMISGPVALLAQDQWRTAWIVFAAMAAAVTVWVAIGLPADRDHQAGRRDSGPALLPRPLFPTGAARLLSTAAVTGVASSAIWTFGRDLLTSTGNLSNQASTTVWIVLGAFGLLGAIAGDLAQRAGPGRAWTACLLTLAAGTALIAVAPESVIMAGIAAAAFGAAYIAVTGLLLVAGTRIYVDQPAAGVGLAFLTLALGQAAGAPVIGLLMDQTGPDTAFWIAALVALVASTVRPTASPAAAKRSRRPAP
jgi:predicted MFS family arabinose efflux permease